MHSSSEAPDGIDQGLLEENHTGLNAPSFATEPPAYTPPVAGHT